MAVKVFFSYSHKDEELRDELAKHLDILEQQRVISSWHDRKILPGEEWDHQINDNLNTADLILLLISSDFIASKYCKEVEVTTAMKRHDAGEACVIAIVLRHVDWKGAPFGKLQFLPKNADPVTSWSNSDEAFDNVTKGIRAAAGKLIRERQQKREAARKKAAIAEYRQKVEEFAADGEISEIESFILGDLQKKLGLTDEEARAVRNQALESHRNYKENLDTYRRHFADKVAEQGYPLAEKDKAQLKLLQDYLKLKDEDLASLEEEAEEQKRQAKELRQQQEAERLRQQREQAEYENKLRRYEQELTRAIQKGYPLDEDVRDGLKNFRESLELTDEDVARIGKPILEQAEAKRRQQQTKKQPSPVTEPQPTVKTQPFKFNTATVSLQMSEWFGRTEVEINRSWGRAEFFTEDLGNGVTLEMVAIPGGEFIMGSPEEEKESRDSERPQHKVTVKPFFMSKYQVTQAQWRPVTSLPRVNRDLDPNPSRFKGDNRPVEKVSWDNAVEFCARLSKLTKRDYRLPSEAEWEYACCGTTKTPFYFGKTITPDLANYDGNYTYGSGSKGVYRQETTPVGQFPPNAFGLYDMHGNVREWCYDPWHDNYEGAPTDGSVWEIGKNQIRVLRGGSWNDLPGNCRSAYRSFSDPDNGNFTFGFRVVWVPARTLFQ